MAIPDLNKYGWLEPGTHATSLPEIQARFVDGDPIRGPLWNKFLELLGKIKSSHAFQAVEFFGSFVSSKSIPSDIDVALELKRLDAPVDFVGTLFDREGLKRDYNTDVLIKEKHAAAYRNIAPAGYSFATYDLRLFRRLHESQVLVVFKLDKSLPSMAKDYKGVLRVEFR